MAELTIRAPRDDEAAALFDADGRGFGVHIDADVRQERAATVDWSRFRIALDGKQIVGIAGSDALDMTLPGGASVPTGGVTWVSVAPTHRRQGVLTRVLGAVHHDIIDRGEPLAALSASEGGIYERFGYGIATRVIVTRLDRSRGAFRHDVDVDRGSVRYIDGDEAGSHVTAVFDRYRRAQPGEVGRTDAWWTALMSSRARPSDGLTPAWHLAHPDGYAVYRVAQDWDRGHPRHRLDIDEFVAVTPAAHAALWHTLINVDLVGVITSRQLRVDDPLPMLLADIRAVRTIENNDGLWAKPLDVAACLRARTYGTTDTLVIDVDGIRYRVDGGPDGASCVKVRSKPDLVTNTAGVGALLLGGSRVHRLVAGRRLVVRDAAVARRADRFFLGDVEPHCQTHF